MKKKILTRDRVRVQMSQSIFFTEYTISSTNDNVIVSTSSVEEVPSNKRNLINLTCNGFLKPSTELYDIVFTFTGSAPKKDFLASSYGTFCIGRKVYNAAKIVKTKWDKEAQQLKILLDLKNTLCRVTTRAISFSFSVQLNDCSVSLCVFSPSIAKCFENEACTCLGGVCIEG